MLWLVAGQGECRPNHVCVAATMFDPRSRFAGLVFSLDPFIAIPKPVKSS